MKCWVEIQLCAACVVNTVVLKWLINWKYWRFLGRKRLSLRLDGRFLNNFQSQRDCLDNKRIGREKERIKSETNQGRQADPLQLIRQWIVNSNTPISKQKREREIKLFFADASSCFEWPLMKWKLISNVPRCGDGQKKKVPLHSIVSERVGGKGNIRLLSNFVNTSHNSTEIIIKSRIHKNERKQSNWFDKLDPFAFN